MTNLMESEEEFVQTKRSAGTLFFLDKVYPENVFATKYANYHFMELNAALDFKVISEIRNGFAAAELTFFCADPDPKGYWMNEMNHFGCFRFDPKSNSTEWEELLSFNPDNSKRTLRLLAKRFLIWDETRQWQLYCDSMKEIAVVGSEKNLEEIEHVHDIEWALQYWRLLEFRLSPQFESRLRLCYA